MYSFVPPPKHDHALQPTLRTGLAVLSDIFQNATIGPKDLQNLRRLVIVVRKEMLVFTGCWVSKQTFCIVLKSGSSLIS